MRYTLQIFIIFLLATSLTACGQNKNDRALVGKEYAQSEIKKAISDNINKPFYDTLIKTKDVAISIVEPILFNIYGKAQIIDERPYECYFIDGFWYIGGTIPKGWKGGGFEIIISAKNAQIIRLIHYK